MSLSREDFATAFRALSQKAATVKDLDRVFTAQLDARKSVGALLVELKIVPADRASVLSASAPVDPRRDPEAVDALGEFLLKAELVNEGELERLVNSFLSLKEKKALPTVPVPKPLHATIDFEWEVGHGVHGTTYRARRAEVPHECAVKVFRPEAFANEAERGAFVGRLKGLVGRNDAGLVPLWAAGEAEGLPYAITAFVEGESIETLIVEHKISVRRGFEIMERVAAALAPLHAKGEAHGHVSASAILVGRDEAPHLAEFGWTAGTPLDDVFAMGEVLYEIATAVPPYAGFHSKELKAASRHNAQAAGSAENVIHRALALNPEQRYPEAGALLEDLRKVLAHQEVPVFVPRAPKSKGSKLPFVLGAAAAVLLIVVGSWLATRPKPAPGAGGDATKTPDKKPTPAPAWTPGPVTPEKKPEKIVNPTELAKKTRVEEWKKKGPMGINEAHDLRYGCTNALADQNWAKLSEICDEAGVRGFYDGKDRDFLHYYGAQAAMQLNDTSKALSEINRAIELNEAEVKYLDLRIAIYLKRTENKKAMSDLSTRHGKNIGEVNRQIAELTRQIQAGDKDPSMFVLRGAYLYYKRNYDLAARDFAAAVQGGDSRARYFLSMSLAGDDRKEAALEALRAFLAGHGSEAGAEEAREFLKELTR